MVLINKNESYVDSNGITTLYNPPYARWKDIIGNKDPSIAKTSNPQSLRGIYGIDIIKNEFWGSDSASDAYRELSNFMFPLPAKVQSYFNFNIKNYIITFLFDKLATCFCF